MSATSPRSSIASIVSEPEVSGFARQKNFLLNVTEFVRRQWPAQWRGALREFPAFVCDADTIAADAAAALAPVADHGVVLASERALRLLACHGVAADFALAMTANHPPEHCLAPGVEPSRVVLSTISAASWREAIAPERRYFLSRAHPTEAWLEEQGVPASVVTITDRAGDTAVELAQFLGCSPVIRIGTDSMPTAPFGGSLRGVAAKRAALARLVPPSVSNPERVVAALAAIGAQGALGCRALPRLRLVLGQQGPAALVDELCRLLSVPELFQTLGSWSESVMPLLSASASMDLGRWPGLLDELEELCCLAESVYGVAIV